VDHTLFILNNATILNPFCYSGEKRGEPLLAL